MKIAITGGTGFVGRHLASSLVTNGHEVVLIARGADTRDESVRQLPRTSFMRSDLSDVATLAAAFAGCNAVAHLAGINREIGSQIYQRVHVEGTRNVVAAARQAGVRRVVQLSFLRARPNCGSGYHESKWEAEEIVRNSGLDYTILKSGMIYGRGDHMLDHISHALHTFPLFLMVGRRPRSIRPVAIGDLVRILEAALLDDRLSRKTVAVRGPEEFLLSDAIRRVARVVGRRVLVLPAPIWMHYALAWVFEKTMKIPLASIAQVRILSEGVVEAAPPCDEVPADLAPRSCFTDEEIVRGLPEPRAFGLDALRCCRF